MRAPVGVARGEDGWCAWKERERCVSRRGNCAPVGVARSVGVVEQRGEKGLAVGVKGG